jgi:hypothetical protein
LPLPIVIEFFNYATQEDVQSLFKIVGIQQVASIFKQQINEWGDGSNYVPVLQNYYELYFQKYAS